MTGTPDGPTPLGIADPAIRQQLETSLLAAAGSTEPWLDAVCAGLLRRPGKRVRPGLLFAAAACAVRYDTTKAFDCAVAVELLHQSSLVHDDLLDESPVRGGAVAVHVTDGQAGAVLAGDYLLAAGGRLIAQVGGHAAGIWHEAYAEMCEGQVRETRSRYVLTSIDEYMETIRGKTAALMRAACVLGGVCAGMADGQLEALATFGESLGMLFQIVDDLMDVLSTQDLWGKAVQHDVAQGVFTLPILLAAAAPASRLTQELRPDSPPPASGTVYETARELGVPPAVTMAYEWADRAREALAVLPQSDARDQLAAVPQRYATEVFASRVASQHQHVVTPYLRAAGTTSSRPAGNQQTTPQKSSELVLSPEAARKATRRS
jgi:geranylgeranyl pyrophosphate synthase